MKIKSNHVVVEKLSAKIFSAKNSPVFLDVVQFVAERRILQRGMLKAGLVEFDMGSPVADDHRKCRRLMQDLGAIADQLESLEQRDNLDSRTALRDAVLQLTADGFAWLESITSNPKTKS